MVEYKLWSNKTVNKNMKSAKMMGYPHKCNFGHFFSSLRVISLCLRGDDKTLDPRTLEFCLGGMSKNV